MPSSDKGRQCRLTLSLSIRSWSKTYGRMCAQWLRARSTAPTFCNFGGVEREVLGGLQQLWLAWNGTAIEAAAVTQLVADRRAENLHLGRMWRPWSRALVTLDRRIEQFARNEGCAAMRIIGRKGWQRILADYRANYVVMDRETLNMGSQDTHSTRRKSSTTAPGAMTTRRSKASLASSIR